MPPPSRVRLPPVAEQLSESNSLLDLARRLGAGCLKLGSPIESLCRDPRATPHLDRLIGQVRAVSLEYWSGSHEPGRYLSLLETEDVGEIVELLEEALHPLEYYGLLSGLCERALEVFYLETEDELFLDRGTPIPFVTRPINTLISATTPHWRTESRGTLLDPLPFELYPYDARNSVQTVLDFRCRDRLDEVTWLDRQRLPRIATVHPGQHDSELEVGVKGPPAFFDVRPRDLPPEQLLEPLKAIEAEIVVISELSLATPDALETHISEHWRDLPPLIVAGSAHIRGIEADGTELRANESRTYLEGKLILAHRKIHPYAIRTHAEDGLIEIREDLQASRKVLRLLSGEHTRLGVAICADLNDHEIPRRLDAAGVNLLLVPALTDGLGSFQGVFGDIASRFQGVAVMANGARSLNPAEEDEPPVLILAAVPRSDGEQTRVIRDPCLARPVVAIVDTNLPLSGAVSWVDEDP